MFDVFGCRSVVLRMGARLVPKSYRAHLGTVTVGPRAVPARSNLGGGHRFDCTTLTAFAEPLRTGTVRAPVAVSGCAHSSRSGFSLIEVMVAILILGVALVGLTGGVTTALSSSKESELQTTAALFASGQMEALRAEGGFTDGETKGDCGEVLPLYRWKQTITRTGIDGLHDVQVVVENAQSGEAIYELQTLLFEVPAGEPASSGSDHRKESSRQGGGK